MTDLIDVVTSEPRENVELGEEQCRALSRMPPWQTLNPMMLCRDCDWIAAGNHHGELACLAVEHIAHNQSHRVAYRGGGFSEDEVPDGS